MHYILQSNYCSTSVPNSFVLNINHQSVVILAQNNFQGIYKGHDEGSENLGLKVDGAKKPKTAWMILLDPESRLDRCYSFSNFVSSRLTLYLPEANSHGVATLIELSCNRKKS